MARPPSSSLTDRESEIMEILWDLGVATSEEVRERLSGKPHDSSVRTLLKVLERKSFVRVNSKKRPAEYHARVPRAKAQKKAVSHLIDRLFGGSAESLVVRLLEDQKISLDQLDELKGTLKKATKEGGRS